MNVTSVVVRGFAVNVTMFVIKLIGGVLGASHALLADAVHRFLDLALLAAVNRWEKEPDSCHKHGHRRLELLIALLMGLVLAATAFGIAFRALGVQMSDQIVRLASRRPSQPNESA